jgi:hypothetical protein
MMAAGAGRLWLACAIAGVLAASGPAQAQVSILSQNALHLGWGQNKTAKYTFFQGLFAQYDIILLQELMPKYATVTGDPVKPAGYNWHVSNSLGPSGYLELYGFLVKSTLTVDNTKAGTVVTYPYAGFSRPPTGILVQTGKTNAEWTWFVNYHAVFGRHVSLRQAEVKNMAAVYQYFAGVQDSQGNTHDRIIMCGDWNLPTDDTAYKALAVLTNDGVPKAATSLTPQGQASSAYDHCFWNETAIGTIPTPQICSPVVSSNSCTGGTAPFSDFRKNISDHLGIYVK